MISFAQNFEDVMLARAFPASTGFYLDVGANDPIVDSVTYHFYRLGWRGITFEPQPELHAAHRSARPDDVAILALAGDASREVDFFETLDGFHGLSTGDAAIAADNALRGWASRAVRRPVVTLDAVLAEHCGGRDIDFLSLDVEGGEMAVLRGLDLARYRPKIIVAEAMAPARQVDVSAPIVAYLAERSYACVYQDGLNRFYLAEEATALADCFRYPPNVFDGFVRRREAELEKLYAAAAISPGSS